MPGCYDNSYPWRTLCVLPSRLRARRARLGVECGVHLSTTGFRHSLPRPAWTRLTVPVHLLVMCKAGTVGAQT